MAFRPSDIFSPQQTAALQVKKLEFTGFLHLIRNRLRPSKLPTPQYAEAPQKNDDEASAENQTKSIKHIPRELCVGCGLCFSACSSEAISMTRDELSYLPQLDDETCSKCEKCYNVCPGINMIEYNGKLGDIQSMYIAHALDAELRHAASSGGVCRSILMSLLEKKIVDKVIITRATNNPYQPETIITSAIEDLSTDHLNSIYSPTSPLVALRGLDKSLRYALVGLPCHIAGLSLARSLRKKIYLTIGIFCSHTPSFKFVDRLIGDLPQHERIERVSYRGNGWPGKSTIYLKGAKPYGIWFPSLWHKYNENKQFQLPRCSICPYYSAEFADISIGDPWGYSKLDRDGSSLVFIRTARGRKCLDESLTRIRTSPVSEDRKPTVLKFHEESASSKQENYKWVDEQRGRQL